VLILDEPTSALDAGTEALILQAMERLTRGRTTFVIAHRFSTIRDADRIVVLDQGEVVEQGTHADLLYRGGAYAGLHRAQFGGGATDEPVAAGQAMSAVVVAASTVTADAPDGHDVANRE
jgi:ABC-type transport system involved in cytochrome bd biosynthesis fused ATPase/permease subunit